MTGTLPSTAANLAFSRTETPARLSHPAAAGLTFAERVSYQRAIEEVYWRHRIWPKENPYPKPSLDAVMTQAQLEEKVEDLSAQITSVWRITGSGRLMLASYKLKWIAWRSTPGSQRYCTNSLKRSGTTPL